MYISYIKWGIFLPAMLGTTGGLRQVFLPCSHGSPLPTLVQVAAQAATSTAGGAGHEILEKSHLSLARFIPRDMAVFYIPGTMETHVKPSFLGVITYITHNFGDVKPLFLMVFGVQG